MNNFWKRIWTEINLDNLIYNFQSVRSVLPTGTRLCCVVKANAYGHHAPRVASALQQAGADVFAVSNIEEAVQLRDAGVTLPIIILGYTPPECAELLSRLDVSQCVYSAEYAEELSKNAAAARCTVKTHIKIDSGMGRIGFQCNEGLGAVNQIEHAVNLDGLENEGIFTHFALSDGGKDGREFTQRQFDKFSAVVGALEDRGLTFKYKHCANSAAALDYPELASDMVRVGIVLYGLLPSDCIECVPPLKPVMSLKTVVSYVKEIEKGDTVSYGCDFVAKNRMKIATVPMGYADGFWRSNGKNNLPLFVRGKQAKIVGRICMDQLMLDVTDIDGVKMGDEVTVFGDDALSVNDFARENGTINYEIICSVGKRVPRVFIKDGKLDGVHLGVLDTTVN